MAAIQGPDKHFNPFINQVNRSGEHLGAGLAQLGAGLGQGIESARQKKREKEQLEAFANAMASNPYVQQHLPTGTTPQEFSQQLQKMDPAQQKAVLQFLPAAAQQQAAADAAMKKEQQDDRKLDLEERKVEVSEGQLDLSKDMSIEEIDQRRAQIEINLLNAETSADRARLAEEEALLTRQKFEKSGEIMELKNGGSAFWDGNKWERIPGSEDKTPGESAKELNQILDPDSPLGQYYLRTRDAEGKRAGKLQRGSNAINPAFEKTLSELGFETFEDKKKTSSSAINLDDL